MTDSALDAIRNEVLACAAPHDPSRAAVEAIAADDAALREILDPELMTEQAKEYALAATLRKAQHGQRTTALLAEKGEQAILDAWVNDSPTYADARRRWAETMGRSAVLADAGRDEENRGGRRR